MTFGDDAMTTHEQGAGARGQGPEQPRPLATAHGPLLTDHWPLLTEYWLLFALLILLSAAAFRLVALPDLPPGLAQDEVLDADIALFIRGGEHALFFGHGYGHEPLYHYLAAPFAPLLGDNWLAIRLPSVYLGLLLVALTMRWARRDYGPAAALVAGLGLAVSWWPVVFSRIGIRPILAPLLLVAAVWFWPLRRPDAAVTRRGLAVWRRRWPACSWACRSTVTPLPASPPSSRRCLSSSWLTLSQRAREKTLSPALWARVGRGLLCHPPPQRALAPNSSTPPWYWPSRCCSTCPSA